MKHLFMKDEAGNMILVTNPEVGKTYLDAEGNEVVHQAPVEAPKAPAVHVADDDPIGKLTGLVSDLVTNQSKVDERIEQLTASVASAQEAAARGFPLPSPEVPAGATPEETKTIFEPFDLAKQGKSLMDKFNHPGYQIQDNETREYVAKWMILFIKAGFFQDREAAAKMRELYPRQGVAKTDLGDSGYEFVIPDIVDAEILAFSREKSVALQYARIWPMISEKQSFPQEVAGVTMGWGNTTSKSNPTIAEVELDAEELSAYSAVRNTTLADSRSDIVSWLTEIMAEAAGQELDNCTWNGDGTSTYASVYGILSSSCGYSVVMASTSTAFSNLTGDHLSEMISKLDGLKKQGARFHLHGVPLHYVRSLKDDQNRPIFTETVGGGVPGMIWGFPYSEVITMPSTSAANTAFLSFGNLRYWAIGRRLDTSTLEVNPYANDAWTTNRKWFKLYQRWALKFALPNGFVRLLTAST
jgi:HK97 family phage major capsid protein